MSLTSDKYRKEQLLSSMANESHPMGKFMWGKLFCIIRQTSNDIL